MHYFFLDECYPRLAVGKRIVMTAWAIEQDNWSDSTANSFALFNPPILKQISSMLESLNGAACVSAATLDESLFRVGEIDGTDDIPSMARPDLIWSISATFALIPVIGELLRHNCEVGTIDIHFDPKSLTSPHSEAWKRLLRQSVVEYGRRAALERGLHQLRKLKIRRVEPVAKAAHRLMRNKFQAGTWVADRLCSHYERLATERGCSRILTCDISEEVRRTVQQFDGKSFYES